MTTLPPVAPTGFTEDEAESLFAQILDGGPTDEAIANFLVALADRGETAAEITGAARAMRARMIAITAPANAIDVCGTGGDGQHSLNVSTAVALVVAACGVPVAKHGNRAASSKAGAADTLEALGLNLTLAGERAEATLADMGICFLFAQSHHPSLGRIAPIRKALGRRTIFNLLGPLANPAGVTRQLIGVAQRGLLPRYAEAMRRLGYERAMVVCGWDIERPEDGDIDEISISGGNASQFIGIPASVPKLAPNLTIFNHYPMSALRGGDAAFNAAALRQLLHGERGAYRDAVLLNSAAALIVADKADGWRSGADMAAVAIDQGAAQGLLDRWIEAVK